MPMDEKELLDRIKELEKENAELRKRLGLIDEPLHPDYEEDKYHIGTELASQAAFSESNFDKFRSPEDKIALFCSLFRGREDVYAVRWQSVATGRSGYSPACANEWRAGFCIKPKGSWIFTSPCSKKCIKKGSRHMLLSAASLSPTPKPR